MFEIQGKVNTAICYAKVVEDAAIEQIRRMCDYSVDIVDIIKPVYNFKASEEDVPWKKKKVEPNERADNQQAEAD